MIENITEHITNVTSHLSNIRTHTWLKADVVPQHLEWITENSEMYREIEHLKNQVRRQLNAKIEFSPNIKTQ